MTIAWSVSPMASDVEFGRLDDPHPLMDAVIRGRSRLLTALINCGEPLDETNTYGWTALATAAAQDKADYVRLLLDAGAKLDIKDHDGHDAFYYAADRNHEAVMDILRPIQIRGLVEKLVDNTSKIDAFEPDGPKEGAKGNLFYAIEEGDTASAALIIKKISNINETNEDGQTGLHIAAENGEVEICSLLMSAGADASQLDDEDFTALMRAIENEHEDVVRALLSGGANPDDLDEEGFSALMAAGEIGNLEIAELLLEAGANVNFQKPSGHTALFAAIERNFDELAALLIHHGANWDVTKGDDGRSIAELALWNGCEKTANSCIENGFNPDEYVKYLASEPQAIGVLCTSGNLTLLRHLREFGADFGARSRSGWTPALAAERKGHRNVVNFLVGEGVDLNLVNDGGHGILAFAVNGDAEPSPDHLNYLLEHGASVEDGTAPLMHELLNWGNEEDGDEEEDILIPSISLFDNEALGSEISGDGPEDIAITECAKILISKGVPFDEPDPSSDAHTTPLVKAVRKKNAGLVRLLLEAGANPNVKIFEDSTFSPLDIACESGRLDIVNALLEYGAEPNNDDGRMFPSIVVAAIRGHLDVVKFLANNGANVSAVTNLDEDETENQERTNALSIAVGNGNDALVETLLKYGAAIVSDEITNEPPLVIAVKSVDKPSNTLTPDEVLGGIPILQYQSSQNYKNICQLLLNAGADANTKFQDRSVLEMAVLADNGDAINELLIHGASVIGAVDQDETPLQMAIKADNIYATFALLDGGAEFKPQGKSKGSVQEMVEICSNRSVNNLLQYYGTQKS